MTNTLTRPTAVYAILQQPVRHIISQIERPEHSDVPVVRTILDQHLGHACYAFARPDDILQEYVLRLETPDPDTATRRLSSTQGVLRAGSLADLRVA
jgi:hypothetical protein